MEEKKGPADEIEALRAILRADLRRRPGDASALMRKATAMARIMALEGRLSGSKRDHLARHMEALLNDLGDLILPADRFSSPPPRTGEGPGDDLSSPLPRTGEGRPPKADWVWETGEDGS